MTKSAEKYLSSKYVSNVKGNVACGWRKHKSVSVLVIRGYLGLQNFSIKNIRRLAIGLNDILVQMVLCHFSQEGFDD